MFEKHIVFLLFLAFAFASQELQLGIETEACDYHSVHMDCGSECSPSGSCDFDICRLCCEQRICPNYFETLCGESPEGVLYVGGNAKPPHSQAGTVRLTDMAF